MHVSFDFDYTLANSSEGTVVCASYALDKLGLAIPAPQAIRETVGFNLEKTYRVLTNDENEEAAAEFKRLFFAHADNVMLDHIHLYPDVPELLKTLKSDGHYVSIVSTKLKHRIDDALTRDGLRHLVDDIVGGGCVEKNKPDPESLFLAAGRSDIALEETVYVGDSISDGECAQRANVAFIAVLTGTTSNEVLKGYEPRHVFNRVGEITSVIPQVVA